MDDEGGFPTDETAPLAATFTEAMSAGEVRATPTASSGELGAPTFPTVALPVSPHAALAPSVPAGWYPLNGQQRFWDGSRWTEHMAPAVQPTYQPAFQRPMITTDARTNGVEVAIAWILTVLTLGYMLPWAIAATRGKSNSGAIGLVNFLLGWTFVGWIVALVMACTAHQVAYVQHRT